jgi:N-acetylglucosaminyldiphosphoundecaprenol N-acetyl-beta-D-mannosaminyltransferase
MLEESLVDHRRVNILGVGVSAINMDQALASFDEWISRNERQYVCVTPAHSVMDCYGKPDLRSIFNSSGMTTPDGMAIVWLLKLKGAHDVSRVYGPDLMRNVCQLSTEKGWRHFLYGGEAGDPEILKSKLEHQYPGIQIVGTYSPPFRPLTEKEDYEVVEMINAISLDIIWIGISTPKQEQWMKAHLGSTNARVMVGVGAAFDFLSGRKMEAPHWIQSLGMQWAFRLFTEPKRLWRRYVQYPLFVVLVLVQALGLKKFPMET